jgi:hypothetical protein
MQNALKPAAQDEFVTRIRGCNTGLTSLNIGSNIHFFRRETGIPSIHVECNISYTIFVILIQSYHHLLC